MFSNLPRALFIIAAVLFAFGCSKEEHGHGPGDGHDHSKDEHGHGPGDGHDHSKDAQHGGANAVAGSYEDWCGEHEVPESKCTRCNSALVAAFKATNDWCAEHGLPESQCVKCDPTRKMVRPPKPAGK